MTEIDQSLDYSGKEFTHSTPHFRNVAPQTSGDVALSATSTSGPTSFIISSSVFNPSKSRLNFELSLPAGGTTSFYNFVQANLLKMISRITLYDQNTSSVLADINNVGNTYSILSPIATTFEDFVDKSHPLVPGVTSAIARLTPYEDIGKIRTATNYLGIVDTGAQNPFFQLRNVINGGSNTTTVMQCSIPFSAFKHSFFSLDKNLYFPQNLQLDIYFESFSKFAWKGSSLVNPSTDEVAVASAVLTGSQMLLQLYTEGNVMLSTQIIQKVMSSGISMPFGYVSSSRFAVATSTSQSWTIPLTQAYGKRVLYTAFAPFNSVETLSTSNNHSRNGVTASTSIIESYNTFINSVPILSPGGFNVLTRGDDYTIGNKEYIKGSALQNVNDFTYNWVHIDNYSRSKICELDQTQVDGLDVTSQQANYQLQANTTATALNWYLVIVGQKTMTITSQGVQVS